MTPGPLAPTGTVTLALVGVTVNVVAVTPTTRIELGDPRLRPVMVTTLPTAAVAGVMPVIVGPTVKVPALAPVPDGVVTDTRPDLAVADGVAVMVVALTTEK